MKRTVLIAAVLVAALSGQRLRAFCGFYVGKADSKLFNHASQVALVREGDRTVLTMANDFQGDPKEFALVVPVPTFIQRQQIEVVDKVLLDHLDAFSAPRLVEYFDQDPCAGPAAPMAGMAAGGVPQPSKDERRKGVTIEATYTVGEYDILILSARESTGLQTWLRENGYKIPAGAGSILDSYIKQGMHFFVAKVNLKEKAALGFTFLRPLQVAYDSPKFMLPIRLGTVNAQGTQDLFIFALTHGGRVETTNYRTVKLPTGMDVPLFVKAEFKDFYTAMFAEQVRKEDMRAVFLEYAWDTAWCDPCSADPLSPEELRKLGVRAQDGRSPFVSRLHVRYDAAHFPEDLVFQETADRQNFQGRYVLRHAWTGEPSCASAAGYPQQLRDRREQEAQNLARLTGWSIADIRRKVSGVKITPAADAAPVPTWSRRLWAALTGE
ncbi:MAG TPA: DUF2330 domain-containing protein [Vicinamibacteria bacterium]|nr:DUF2330 domain-containing protein [Vicinamibacteria bacterium]